MSDDARVSFDDASMLELFRLEVETQCAVLSKGLIGIEQCAAATPRLTELMRAAHSLKGAARIVGRKSAVRIAHAMEDCFVAAQKENRTLSTMQVDRLLAAVDWLQRIAQPADEALEQWEAAQQLEIESFLASFSSLAQALTPAAEAIPSVAVHHDALANSPAADRVLRITADRLNHLMGLTGEALVASRWLNGFATDMQRMKQLQRQLAGTLDRFRDSLPSGSLGHRSAALLTELRDKIAEGHTALTERMADLDSFDCRYVNFSRRLYHEVLDCRMRPFTDGVQGLPRMVRDVAQSLQKSVRLEITGEGTPVDREILERLKSPLDHLIRNCIDHGIESPAERIEKGKPAQGLIRLRAFHSNGILQVMVSDDGRGVDLAAVRQAIVERNLTTLETTTKMTSAELLEFLFLPGFTLKKSVSEISGRGVGLDAVQTMVKEIGGRARIFSENGQGMRFHLELPLTLSVVRTLLVEIGDEPYAFPLARIERAMKLPMERIEVLQGRQHFAFEGEQISLMAAHQIFGMDGDPAFHSEVPVVVFGDKAARYGVAVGRFLGERELVVRALDPRLGKVENISSAALMPDGSPVLIVDIDDLKRGIENLASGTRISQVNVHAGTETARKRKRVLIVDDSLTVREVERKLLDLHGYLVDVAVDGMDGWNGVRTGVYDLIVTDIDMPRMDGIELIKLIRKDARFQSLPVIIVSYKDREEDRTRGLEAGADYYLTKASFHDETLVRVAVDLIGEPDA